MKFNLKNLFSAVALSTFVLGAIPMASANFSGQIQYDKNGKNLIITSEYDNVIVKDVIVNRGNCRLGDLAQTFQDYLNIQKKWGRIKDVSKGYPLAFAESIVLRYAFAGCNIREVQIKTNLGAEVLRFNNNNN